MFGIFIRVISIDKIPIGINVDEAGIAYDAYCIANYGVDRYLYHNPVYTINYGGGQSVLYTYLVALFIKLFDFHFVIVRLPALLFSIISIFIFYFMIKDFKNRKLAIIATFLITIVPWHFMQSRWGLDCNLMSSMLLISIFVLLKVKNKFGYVLSGILFGITLYTYALSYIIVPVLLIGLLLYLFAIKRIQISDIICLAIPLLGLALPLVLNLFVNKGWIAPIQNQIFSTPKLWEYREAEISIFNIPKNILPIIKCMFTYDINDYNAFPQFGTLYYISIPFFIIGLISCMKHAILFLKKKDFHIDIIFTLYFLSIFACLLFVKDLSISKANGIYIPMIYFIAVGIYQFAEKNKYVFIGIMIFYLVMFLLFQYYYFFVYGNENPKRSFEQTIIDAVEYIENNENFADKTINIWGPIQPYIYTLLANMTNPYEFNENLVVDRVVYQYGRYVFYNTEIDDNTVYLLKDFDFLNQFGNALLANGFVHTDFEDVHIFYKIIE